MSSEQLAESLPEGQVLTCRAIRIRLSPDPHPWEVANATEIAANWEREIAANPALFNGRVTLVSSLAFGEGVLSGVSHEIDFATFLFWRKHPDQGWHAFAYAVPVTADNCLMAIRMGAKTANPGRVYFAAGSFEAKDFTNGFLDFDANAHREALEETGLNMTDAKAETGFQLLRFGAAIAIFRRYAFLGVKTDDMVRQVEAFVAADPDPEIEGPVVLRNGAFPSGLTRHAKGVAEWHFSQG